MLRKSIIALAAVGVTAAPVHAADVRSGAFVGARIHMSLGGRQRATPHAALTLAPTSSRISSSGMVHTRIGDGLALDFARKPTLTIAGVRADTAFSPQRRGTMDPDKKIGISTGGWVAIGVGVAAVIGGAYFVHLVYEADKNSD